MGTTKTGAGDKKFSISNLVIETTRRCNARCAHCLRGDAEDIDLNLEYAEKLLSQVSYISTLTMSGGEPSLVPSILKGILKLCKKHKVGVGSFYMATNALHVSDQFIKTMMDWYLYCLDNEMSAVDISNDVFHPTPNPRNVQKLKILSFVHNKFEKDGYDYKKNTHLSSLINEGRGGDFYGRPVIPEIPVVEDEDFGYGITIEGTLYLNVHGDIVCDCDWSYESQEDNIICHCTDDILHVIRSMETKKLELEVEL